MFKLYKILKHKLDEKYLKTGSNENAVIEELFLLNNFDSEKSVGGVWTSNTLLQKVLDSLTSVPQNKSWIEAVFFVYLDEQINYYRGYHLTWAFLVASGGKASYTQQKPIKYAFLIVALRGKWCSSHHVFTSLPVIINKNYYCTY